MTDLVKRLNDWARYNTAVDPRKMCLEAAAEITHRTKEVERLTGERDEYGKALVSLTCGGSEFFKDRNGVPVADAEMCVQYVRKVREQTVNAAKIAFRKMHDATARAEAAEARVKVLEVKRRREFVSGYAIACSNLVHLHHEPGLAADLMHQAGITWAEVEALDLTEFDMKALREIKNETSREPFHDLRASLHTQEG